MTEGIFQPLNIRPGQVGDLSVSRAGLSPLLVDPPTGTRLVHRLHLYPGPHFDSWNRGQRKETLGPILAASPPTFLVSRVTALPRDLGNWAFVTRGFKASKITAGWDRTGLGAGSSGEREGQRPGKWARSYSLPTP